MQVYCVWAKQKQDGHKVESPCKSIVFGQNKNKLRGLRAQSIVHTIERVEQQI